MALDVKYSEVHFFLSWKRCPGLESYWNVVPVAGYIVRGSDTCKFFLCIQAIFIHKNQRYGCYNYYIQIWKFKTKAEEILEKWLCRVRPRSSFVYCSITVINYNLISLILLKIRKTLGKDIYIDWATILQFMIKKFFITYINHSIN